MAEDRFTMTANGFRLRACAGFVRTAQSGCTNITKSLKLSNPT